MLPDRSLIPGLGAAASLVAAVACAFFVTAAVVAFHSWPQVTAGSNARALIVAADKARVRAYYAPPTRRIRATSRPVVSTAGRPPRPTISAQVIRTPRPRPTRAVTPTITPTSPSSTPAARSQPAATATAPKLSPNTLAGATQTTTSNVGGLVNGLTNGVANTVAPVSPALADTVNNLGNSVSGAVVSIGNNLAELLLGLNQPQ